jgi:transposase
MTECESDGPKGVRRLKRWAIDQKLRIVEETFVPGASVSLVARRHNANANQVFAWRRQYRQGTLVDRQATKALPGQTLIRIGAVDHDGDVRPLPVSCRASVPPHVQPRPQDPVLPKSMISRVAGQIEIELSGGIKVRVDAHVDDTLLRRVLSSIKDVA